MAAWIVKLLWKLPHRVVTDECAPQKGPLMVRWFLLRSRWFTVMLHCFLRSDNDKCFHDHPWDFVSLLLTPYVEHTPFGVFHHKRFALIMRPAEWRHWVEVERKRTWTIVIHFKRRRIWGFLTDAGWIRWDVYSDLERCK